MHKLVALPAFTDNYIWMLHDDARALVVDPGEAAPVHAALDEQGLELAAILVTHHHADHVGGVDELRQRCTGAGFGPAREPDNRDIPTHLAWCADERSRGRSTLPSTIALERRINPFLRADVATVAACTHAQGAVDDQPVHVFAALREWKNRFR
jgi:hypothetical protein